MADARAGSIGSLPGCNAKPPRWSWAPSHFKAVLTERLRISGKDAARRLADAKELGPRTAFTGEPLTPLLAETAAAQAAGTIGPEHVEIIRSLSHDLPGWVDPLTREQAEATLVHIAGLIGPEVLREDAVKLATAIDQDGPAPDDRERARKRDFRIGPQGPDGMSRITGWLDPQGRATWEPVHAKLAAPGMCNPDDCEPCTSGTPSRKRRSMVMAAASGNVSTTRSSQSAAAP